MFTTIKPSDNSVQQKKVMGENEVNIDFETSYNLAFQIGDSATIFGEVYKINRPPVITKMSRLRFKYSLSMQAEYFDLTRVQYLFYDADNRLREGDFSLMGNIQQFADLMTKNLSRVYAGWTFGEVPPSTYKNITFSNDNCLTALAKIVEAFETEYWINGKVISILKRKNDTGDYYRQGQNKGLYEINRQGNDQAQVVTRVYPFGSEKNLPPDYRNYSKRLKLAEKDPCLISALTCTGITPEPDGTERYDFMWSEPDNTNVTAVSILCRRIGSGDSFTSFTGSKTGHRSVNLAPGFYEFAFQSQAPGTAPCDGKQTPTIPITAPFSTPLFQGNALPYVEANTDKYGVIESAIVFEDIFPARTGRVSSVNAGDPFQFVDSDIDFDVNGYLLPGVVAKVTFNTGQLAGYTFDVSSFNNADKRFRILKNKNENQLDIPSPLLKPAIGDLYVITDIRMPQQYIEAAEQKLLEKAVEYLNTYSSPTYTYTVVFDPVYLKNRNKVPSIGDVVWLQDDDLELNKPIRIISSTRKIVNEFDISVELADILSDGTIKRLTSSIANVSSNVNSVSNDLRNSNLLQNNRVTGDLRIDQGSIVAPDMPEKPVSGTFKVLYLDEATGKVYKG